MTLGESLRQAHILLQSGKAEEAVAQCHRILATWPNQTDSLHLLGLIAQERGQTEAALGHLRQACAAPGARAIYFSNFAEMCRRAHLLEEAEQAARRAVGLDADLPAAWNNLGIVLQETGRYAESRTCLERVLALTPASPQAHNNFANTSKRLGLLAEAERHWYAALQLRDDYPEPHSNLAHLCSDLGAYDRAAYHARRAIGLAPRFVDAHLNLSRVETARGAHAAALAVLDQLLEFASAHPAALAARALALQQLDRLEDGLDCARRAVAASPGSAEALYALGQLSHAIGDTEMARDAYGKAAALPGPLAETAAGSEALLLMELGEASAAAEAFEKGLTTWPRSAVLWFNRADLKRFSGPTDPDIAAMRALLQTGAQESAHDRMLLHFALGNACLQVGASDEAFLHLHEGNRMKRAGIQYDAAATTRWMARIATEFDAASLGRLGALRGNGGDTDGIAPGIAPVFIIGVPRSGTSLVEQILASHPAVFGAGELQFLAGMLQSLGEYPSFAGKLTGADLHRIGAGYMAQLARRTGGRLSGTHGYVTDKMPANFLYAGLIHLCFPQAKIIHCRRDALDTCLSCYSKLFTREQLFTYDQAELGRFHLDYQLLMAHWRSVLPRTHFLEVDYEDVVADLDGQARRMLGFLGLPWSESCTEFYRTPRRVRTASVNQVRQPIYSGSVGAGSRHAAHLGPLLAALGRV
jgi:tetratricopeptide (TPR) repeat protein